MSNYNSLKATIDANIKQNGNQEITGQILNSVLNQMVNILGTGYQFAGVATLVPATDPGTPDAKVFYIANGKGTYTKFGGLEVKEDDVVVLYWDTAWHKVSTGIASQAKLSELEATLNGNSIFLKYFEQGQLIYANGDLHKRSNTTGSVIVDVSHYIGHTITFNYDNALASSYALVRFYNVDTLAECSSSTVVGEGIIGSIHKGDTLTVPEGAKIMLCFGFEPETYQQNFPNWVIAPTTNSIKEDIENLDNRVTDIEEGIENLDQRTTDNIAELDDRVTNLDNKITDIEATLNGNSISLKYFEQGQLIYANGDLHKWTNTTGSVIVDVSHYIGHTITFNYDNALASSYALVRFYNVDTLAECSSSTVVGEGIIGSIHKGDTLTVPEGAKIMLCFGFEPETYQQNFPNWVIAPTTNSIKEDIENLDNRVTDIEEGIENLDQRTTDNIAELDDRVTNLDNKITDIEATLNGNSISLKYFEQGQLIYANGDLHKWTNTTGSVIVDVSHYIGHTITFNYDNALASSYALVRFYNVDTLAECSSSTVVGEGIIGSIHKGDTLTVPEGAKIMLCFGFEPETYQQNFPNWVIAPTTNSIKEDIENLDNRVTDIEEGIENLDQRTTDNIAELDDRVTNLDNKITDIEATLNGNSISLKYFEQGQLIYANGDLHKWTNTTGSVIVDVSHYIGHTITFNYDNALASSYALVRFYNVDTLAECSSSTVVGEGIIGSIHKGDTLTVPEGAKIMLCFGFEPETYQQNFPNWVIALPTNSIKEDIENLDNRVSDIETILDSKLINCWGDSLTAAGVYEKYINSQFKEYTVKNFGVGGEHAYSILVRQGGLQCYLGEDITILANASSINMPNFYYIKEDGTKKSVSLATTAEVFPVNIRDIKINSDGSIVNPPSKEITIYKDTPVNVNSKTFAKKSKATVYWIGTNGLTGACPTSNDDVDKIINLIKNAIKWEQSRVYCVLGVYSADARFPDSCRDYMDEQMKAEFESHFIDVRYNLCKYGLTDAGITPTEQDLIDLSTNDVPTSLRVDGLHLTSIGYNLVGKMICESFKMQGL